jgi:hypothetical protein
MGATDYLYRVILCSLLGVSFCYAQSTLIFASNYDLALTTNGAQSRAQSRVEVRNESTFPIEFQKHKIHITVSAISKDQYTITMSIYEKSLGSWFEINAGDISFGGTYSIPVEYKWSGADVHLNLAIVVSPKSST